MPPFGGPIPPSLTPAPPNAGPAAAPHGNPGNTMQGLSDLKIALDAMQRALPSIPMGTELHQSIISSISKIGKHMTEMQDSPQMKMQNLLQMIAKLKAAAPNQALAGLAAPAGLGGAHPPGAPPAPPLLAPPTPPPAALAA